MSTPLVKPRLQFCLGLWYCFCVELPTYNRTGRGNTPHEAYIDWTSQLHNDGIYWEFFT